MNYREKMREYLTEPGVNGSAIGYGRWGALNPEQRKMIRRLLDEMDSADEYIKHQYLENEKNKAIIKGIKKHIKNYYFKIPICSPETEYYIGWNGALNEIEKIIEILEKNIGKENER